MSSIGLHARIFGISLLPLLIFGGIAVRMRQAHEIALLPPTIAVEHEKPLELGVRLSIRGGTRLIDLSPHSQETIFISVPVRWQRTEVRGAALTSVTSETPTFGFVRWTFPPGASVGFKTEGSFRSITLQNPTKKPLTVSITSVNLETNVATHDVVLVKDEAIVIP